MYSSIIYTNITAIYRLLREIFLGEKRKTTVFSCKILTNIIQCLNIHTPMPMDPAICDTARFYFFFFFFSFFLGSSSLKIRKTNIHSIMSYKPSEGRTLGLKIIVVCYGTLSFTCRIHVNSKIALSVICQHRLLKRKIS